MILDNTLVKLDQGKTVISHIKNSPRTVWATLVIKAGVDQYDHDFRAPGHVFIYEVEYSLVNGRIRNNGQLGTVIKKDAGGQQETGTD